MLFVVFKQKTAYEMRISDWSSDVCSSDLAAVRDLKHYQEFAERGPAALGEALQSIGGSTSYDSDFEEAVAEGLRRKGWTVHTQIGRSEERRVGKEWVSTCRSRW